MAEQAQKEPTMEEILSSIRKIIADDEPTEQLEAQGGYTQAAAPSNHDVDFDELDLSLDDDSDDQHVERLPDNEDELLSAISAFGDEAEEMVADVTSFDDYNTSEDVDVFGEDDAFTSDISFDDDETTDALSLDALADDISDAVTEQVEEELTFETVALDTSDQDGFDEYQTIEEDTDMSAQAHLTDARTVNAATGSLGKLFAKAQAPTAPTEPTDATTVEGLVREALRPMLKEWLDANLPAIVDKHVEAEVKRIARMAR